jgi:hypothetical protein
MNPRRYIAAGVITGALLVAGIGAANAAGDLGSSPKHAAAPQPPCITDWNAPGNATTRAAMNPPHGTFPLVDASGTSASPSGTYQVYEGTSGAFTAPTSGGDSTPSVCYVYFYYPTGFKGGPALVSVAAPQGSGSYDLDAATMSVGRDTDVTGATRAAQNSDGTLTVTL